MQSSLSLSLSPHTSLTIPRPNQSSFATSAKPINLRFCGLRREALGDFSPLLTRRVQFNSITARRSASDLVVSAALSGGNGSPTKSFDYDLLIIGAGVGGHGAALHAVEKVRSPMSLQFVLVELATKWIQTL